MKTVGFLCASQSIALHVPDEAVVYESTFPDPATDQAAIVIDAVERPAAGRPLTKALAARRNGKVVVVVSDITRPIPYSRFLPQLLALIESAGVRREEIVVLVATGMHRVSTPEEHREMFGAEVCERYTVVDHDAGDERSLAELPGKSWSGNRVKLNARFVNAGFRIVTGLVEPHFMAGFSGGRKAVCPGLADLQTVRNFHGHEFLSNPAARNGNLSGNPLHEEALSVAQLAGVDFSLNVVLNHERTLVGAFAGPLEQAHVAACALVRKCSCPTVAHPADLVVTSCGGYPLDATFYQCVKGMVSCLPAVRPGGAILAIGGCSEGIGGEDYTRTMMDWGDNWKGFLAHIASPAHFSKDQWQFQMQCRALSCAGVQNLHFATPGLSTAHLSHLAVTGHVCPGPDPSPRIQSVFDSLYRRDMAVAMLPEGPYCAPMLRIP